MLDIYMLKTGKFQKILENVNLCEILVQIFDMFFLQSNAKGIDLILQIEEGTPEFIESDSRRF